MRIVMPLFDFSYKGNGFKFTEKYSLEPFDYKKEVPQGMVGLSELDISKISLEDWALVVNNPDARYYRQEINLLFIAFRVYSHSNVFIKWRFCKDNSSHSTCLHDCFRKLIIEPSIDLTEDDLTAVQKSFLRILEMYNISDRTKNALYFVWRGLSCDKHIDAYIFLVCAIEALFSGENSIDVTKTLIKRTQKFLSGEPSFGGDQIKKVYKIRSDMVHGRISHTDKKDLTQRQENLDNLAKLEALVFICFKKVLNEKIYLKYNDMDEKEKFLNSLWHSAI